MNTENEMLYDVHWQMLRLTFLGHWDTAEGQKGNLHRLHSYVGAAVGPQELLWRLRRAEIMLDSLRRRGLATELSETRLMSYRRLKEAMLEGGQTWGKWNWEQVELDLAFVGDRQLQQLKQNIKNRQSAEAKQMLHLVVDEQRSRKAEEARAYGR